MKVFLLLITLAIILAAKSMTSNFERSRLDPTVEEPLIEGTTVPVEDLNTAPAPVPEFEEEALPGTLVPGPEVRKKSPPKKMKPKKQPRREASF